MTNKITYKGHQYDYDSAVNMMDDDLREQLHDQCCGDNITEQEFFDDYCKLHETKFGAAFAID